MLIHIITAAKGWLFMFFLPNSYVETLTPRVMVGGGEPLGGEWDFCLHKRDPRELLAPFGSVRLQQAKSCL